MTYIRELVSLLFLLFHFATSCTDYGDINLPGKCPNHVKYQQNIDLQKLQGAWYVQQLSNHGPDACSDGCLALYFSRYIDNVLFINFCCKSGSDTYCGTDIGSGFFTANETQTGLITYTSGPLTTPAYILGTDYDNYLIGVFCILAPDGTPNVAIYSYTRTPRPKNMKTFKSFVTQLLKRSNINPKLATLIKQGDQCNYNFYPPKTDPYAAIPPLD